MSNAQVASLGSLPSGCCFCSGPAAMSNAGTGFDTRSGPAVSPVNRIQ